MRNLGFALSSIAFVGFVAACSSSGSGGGGGGGGGTRNKDATTSSDGSSTGDGGSNPGDAGIIDTGPQGPCNPTDGTGCGMQTCIYINNVGPDLWCRNLAPMTVAGGMACDQGLQNCQAGYTCLTTVMGQPTTCQKVCRIGMNADCAAVTDPMGNPYSCLLNLDNTYGLCAPTPTSCVPYNDMCPAMEHCDVLPGPSLGCVPDGTATLGQPCSGMNGACVRGTICVNLSGTPKCEEPCDFNNVTSCTSMAARCSGELSAGTPPVNLGFGVCGEANCNPLTVATDCQAGENCDLVGTTTMCVNEGTATLGNACSGQNPCQRGGVCVNLSGGMGPQCYQPCDPMTPMCTMGQCNTLTGIEGWGICI